MKSDVGKPMSKETLKYLVSSANYRDFIKRVIESKRRDGRRFGYSDIARYAGFSSRSFPRDVAIGKKKISLQSLHKLSVGLGLTGDLAQYFRILVEIEHPSCRLRPTSLDRQLRSLQNLKGRILQKSRIHSLQPLREGEVAFSVPTLPLIYAALGTTETGASISEIQKRTGLRKNEIATTLTALKESDLVEKQNDRYFAKEGHLSFQGLKQSEIYQKFYLHLIEQASANARARFNSDEHLFFSSSLSIDQSDLPKLKESLRAVLLDYVDRTEKPSGDKVVSIACSFF